MLQPQGRCLDPSAVHAEARRPAGVLVADGSRDPRGFAGSRSAFPLQSESRCLSGGLVLACTIPRAPRAVNANRLWPVDDLGDKSGAVVDRRQTGCGQLSSRLWTRKRTQGRLATGYLALRRRRVCGQEKVAPAGHVSRAMFPKVMSRPLP
jgi:hypothetical protein